MRSRLKGGLIYGVGIYEPGRFRAGSGGSGNLCRGYDVWFKMLERCYSKNALIFHPSYSPCEVDIKFHRFQDFMEWLVAQVGYSEDGSWQLDKDLLISGNKVYSPEACVLLPMEVNGALKLRKKAGKDLPAGVHLYKRTGKFMASLSMHGKKKTLGFFDSVDSAYDAYKGAREFYMKSLAEKWNEHLDRRAYNALMTYKVDDRKEYKQ